MGCADEPDLASADVDAMDISGIFGLVLTHANSGVLATL
jgi:hypothetical protein